MKKFLVVLSLLVLTGCSSTQAEVDEPAELLTYPLASTSSYLGEAEPLPETVFTTTASENGLAGTVFTFSGTVTDFLSADESFGVDTIYVETEYGQVSISNMYEALVKNSVLTELAIGEENCDYSFPEVGETVNLICVYAGYSGTLEMPSFYFGANEFVVDGLREDNDSPAAEATPSSVPDPNGFFADRDRAEAFRASVEAWDWMELEAMITSYIESEAPAEDDVVHDIQLILSETIETFNRCTRTTDEVEGFTTLTYPGAEELSESIHIAPTLRDWDFYLTMGITMDEWLFFDKIVIAADGEQLYSRDFDSYDVDTDVLDNGNVRERVRTEIIYSVPEFESIADAETATIRFKNTSTDDYVDYTLSVAEAEACQTMLQLWNTQELLQSFYLDSF